MNIDEPETVTTQQARQGKELGSVRYVLYISLALAVIASVVLYLTYFAGPASS